MPEYDPFGVNGGGTSSTAAPTNYTGGSAKSNAGRMYDPFNIASVTPVANPNPAAKPIVKAPAPKQQNLLQKIGGGVKDVAVGTKNFGEAGAKSVYDIGRGAVASGSYPGGKANPKALANAHAAKAKDFPAFAGTIYRPMVQAVESIAHPLSQHSVAPKTAVEQELLGKQPIQNINKGVASTYQAQKAKGKSGIKSSLLAGLYGVGQVAQDAGTIAGVKAGGVVDDAASTVGKVKGSIKTVAGKDEATNTALQTAKQNNLLNKARTSNTADDIGKTATRPEPTSVEPVKPTITPHTETQALKPAEKLMATAEPAKFADTYLKNNKEQAQADYAARTRKEFGNTKNNVVSGDEAKFIIPGFKASNSVPYHEAASVFAKEHYAQLLKNPATKDQPVMIMAGGSGAGKTSSLRQVMGKQGDRLDNYAAVVDTNLTDMKGAESRIQAAKASGRGVVINYVYRDPDEAYANGVIPRAARTGRVVTPAIHASTHAGSFNTIFELADKYKNDPNVEIRAIDNSKGYGKHVVVPLDSLKNKGYTKDQIELKTHQLLDEGLKSNTITKDEYHDLKGTSDTNQIQDDSQATSGRISSDVVGQPKSTPEETTGNRPSSPESNPKPSVAQAVDKELASRTKTTLTPSQTTHMPEIGGYTHSETMASDYADMLQKQEKSVQGGQILKNADGSYRRTSEHSSFYRSYFKENGRAPSKAAYLEQAKLELESGKDALGAAKDYQTLRDREGQPIPRAKIKASPVGFKGETKTSKLALGVEQQAVKQKLTKSLGDLPQYSKVNMKEQAQLATDLMKNDQQKAIDIALGKETPPHNVLPESIFTTVEMHAQATGDVQLLKELANSTRVGEATAMGQRIRALGERDPDGAVNNIRTLTEIRAKTFEAKNKTTVGKAIKATTDEIKAAKTKIALTPKTWSDFVESIKC